MVDNFVVPQAEQQQLQGLTLRDLALSGGSLCRALVMALLDKYHGDEANISAISRQLRSVCPSLYRAEDAQLSAASQLILGARSTSDPTARDAAFAQAVALCKGVGGCVNVAGVAAQLAGGGCYTGLVDLALSVAGQRDNEGRALLFYKTGQPPNDSKGYAAFTSRMECYRVVMEHLAQLASNNSTLDTSSPSAVSVPARPGPPTPATKPSKEASCHAQQMIELLCRSGDELAQVTLFQWLLDTGRTEQLLALPCPSLEGFLKAPPKGSPRHDLLWRFYERNKEYYKAARTLALLADEPGSTSLGDRVEHLSRSLMCLSSCEMNTASAFTDFLLHLEEKKDVARVQLMVLEGVKAAGGDEDALRRLNSSLLDITSLYEQFAEPYELWQCKLAIVACAGHSEPQLVQVRATSVTQLVQVRATSVAQLVQVRAASVAQLVQVKAASVAQLVQVRAASVAQLVQVRAASVAQLVQVGVTFVTQLVQVRVTVVTQLVHTTCHAQSCVWYFLLSQSCVWCFPLSQSCVWCFPLSQSCVWCFPLSQSYVWHFPLKHIIRLCEVQSVRLKAASVGSVGWLAAALLSCGVTITRLLHTYHA
ncbi:Nucleoporin Nup133/Nup155-like C-terminal [Trinorchestia longiramus]|nr:Nucleoporin Nup133/Nup155-like C-terminal [Trinorchestia longiramus]